MKEEKKAAESMERLGALIVAFQEITNGGRGLDNRRVVSL